MPKYVYNCYECNQTYEVVHSFSEKRTCCAQINKDSKCSEAENLQRVPQEINYLKKEKDKKTQTGQIVDEFIKDTKKEVKEYKEQMINLKPK